MKKLIKTPILIVLLITLMIVPEITLGQNTSKTEKDLVLLRNSIDSLTVELISCNLFSNNLVDIIDELKSNEDYSSSTISTLIESIVLLTEVIDDKTLSNDSKDEEIKNFIIEINKLKLKNLKKAGSKWVWGSVGFGSGVVVSVVSFIAIKYAK